MAKTQTIKLTDGKQVITVNAADAKDPRFKDFKAVGGEAKTEVKPSKEQPEKTGK